VAVEADRVQHGGVVLLSQITGMDERTIQRGQQKLEHDLFNRPIGAEQVRLSGGSRKRVEKKDPTIYSARALIALLPSKNL
jgi:hypothetical protein